MLQPDLDLFWSDSQNQWGKILSNPKRSTHALKTFSTQRLDTKVLYRTIFYAHFLASKQFVHGSLHCGTKSDATSVAIDE